MEDRIPTATALATEPVEPRQLLLSKILRSLPGALTDSRILSVDGLEVVSKLLMPALRLDRLWLLMLRMPSGAGAPKEDSLAKPVPNSRLRIKVLSGAPKEVKINNGVHRQAREPKHNGVLKVLNGVPNLKTPKVDNGMPKLKALRVASGVLRPKTPKHSGVPKPRELKVLSGMLRLKMHREDNGTLKLRHRLLSRLNTRIRLHSRLSIKIRHLFKLNTRIRLHSRLRLPSSLSTRIKPLLNSKLSLSLNQCLLLLNHSNSLLFSKFSSQFSLFNNLSQFKLSRLLNQYSLFKHLNQFRSSKLLSRSSRSFRLLNKSSKLLHLRSE